MALIAHNDRLVTIDFQPGSVIGRPTVYLTRGETVTDSAEHSSDTDKVSVAPYKGNLLGRESVAPNSTVGDWIIWSMVPLHFGTQWGFTVKII